MADLVAIIAEHGLLVVVLALTLFALKNKDDAVTAANVRALAAEKSRTEDAQKVAKMLIEQAEKANATLTTLSTAMQGNQHAIRAVESAVTTAMIEIRGVMAEIRNMTRDR